MSKHSRAEVENITQARGRKTIFFVRRELHSKCKQRRRECAVASYLYVREQLRANNSERRESIAAATKL